MSSDASPVRGDRRGLGRIVEAARTPLRAGAYALVANQVLSAALGLAYWMLAARLYGAEVVGASSAVISTLLLIAGIAELGLNSGMVRFLPRAGERTRQIILLAYAVSIAASLVLGVAFVAAGEALGLGRILDGGLAGGVLVVAAAGFRALFRLQDAVLTGLKHARWVLIENAIYNVAKIVVLVLGVGYLGRAGIVGSWFLPTPFVILLCAWLIFGVWTRPGRLSPAPAGSRPLTLREVLASSGTDHIGSLVAEAATRLLPLLVVGVLGATANAYFYQAWLVATTLSLFAGAMADSFTAEAAGDCANIGRYSRDILRQMALVVLPTAAVLGVGAPLVLTLFGAAYAAEGSTLLRWLCLASPLIVFNTWFLAYARVTRRIGLVVALEATSAVLLLGLGYALLGPLGITGIGVAWLASQVPVTITGILTSHRTLTAADARERAA